MRLIDVDAAKAELLRIAGDIHGWGEFFDGIDYVAEVVEVDKQKIIAERINQVVELTANGVPTKDIAKHLGISLSSVYRYQREGLANDN